MRHLQEKGLATNEALQTTCINDTNDAAENFKAAIENFGLIIKGMPIADGRLRRCDVHGDRAGTLNGWYVLYGGGIFVGVFGNWKTGQKHKWCAKSQISMTASEKAEYGRKLERARKARKLEEVKQRAEAQRKANFIWYNAESATEGHPYLKLKGVLSHALRQHNGRLVVPMRDRFETLHSLQFIDGEGNKRFLSGGRKRGCYFLIGVPTASLCIAEGYATAASIYEATGVPCVVAFDAGNLMSVAKAIRLNFPDIKITICADNDSKTLGNPGLTKAYEAAGAIGALLAVPPCHGDFNDLFQGVHND
jgi:putative DNA primase/helicase